jgi:ribosomal protein S18 acetylase RimI-like enzyme
MLDIDTRVLDPSVQSLLSHSIGFPTAVKLEMVCRQFQSESNWMLRGYELDSDMVGCIGVEILQPGRATVRHIAVMLERRHQGIGRSMLRQLSNELKLEWLIAETDSDALGFYQQCGFDVESLGELYPGVERFRCTLRLRATQLRRRWILAVSV